MRKLEISAYTIDEAKVKAFEQGITVIEDATYAWYRAGKPMLKKQLDLFVTQYLEKRKLFSFEGAGLIITLKQGKFNNKSRGHELINYPKKGPRKMKRCVEIRNADTDELIALAKNKKQAIKKAKEIVRNRELNVYGVTKYIPQDKDFELHYKQSKLSVFGQYLVFGVDDGDVRLLKQQLRNF